MVGAKGTVIELLCGVLTMCKRGALGPSASPFLFDDIVLTLDVLSHRGPAHPSKCAFRPILMMQMHFDT